jgi:hypothetical protein
MISGNRVCQKNGQPPTRLASAWQHLGGNRVSATTPQPNGAEGTVGLMSVGGSGGARPRESGTGATFPTLAVTAGAVDSRSASSPFRTLGDGPAKPSLQVGNEIGGPQLAAGGLRGSKGREGRILCAGFDQEVAGILNLRLRGIGYGSANKSIWYGSANKISETVNIRSSSRTILRTILP